jgi:hypothetical protein
MRRDGRLTGYLLRMRKSFEERKNSFAFKFKIHEGFVRSFGWISPGPLYSWKRGPVVVLYPATCARLLLLLSQPERVDREKRKPRTSSPPLPPLSLGDG